MIAEKVKAQRKALYINGLELFRVWKSWKV
jgi:hypothetical protein